MMRTRILEIAGTVVMLAGIALGALISGAVEGRSGTNHGLHHLSSVDPALARN